MTNARKKTLSLESLEDRQLLASDMGVSVERVIVEQPAIRQPVDPAQPLEVRQGTDATDGDPLSPWEKFCLTTSDASDLGGCLDGVPDSTAVDQFVDPAQSLNVRDDADATDGDPLSPWEKFCLTTSDASDLGGCLDGVPDSTAVDQFVDPAQSLNVRDDADATDGDPLSPWEKFCLTTSDASDLGGCLDGVPARDAILPTKILSDGMDHPSSQFAQTSNRIHETSVDEAIKNWN
jgi:hypothetical protein